MVLQDLKGRLFAKHQGSSAEAAVLRHRATSLALKRPLFPPERDCSHENTWAIRQLTATSKLTDQSPERVRAELTPSQSMSTTLSLFPLCSCQMGRKMTKTFPNNYSLN